MDLLNLLKLIQFLLLMKCMAQVSKLNIFACWKYKILICNIQNIKEQKNHFLCLLANVGALFSTFFACFAFVYKYYSRNYNNYYLVSKLFSSTIIKNLEDNNKKAKTKKNIELGKALNVNEEISTDSNKSSVLIDDVNDEKNINVKDGSENIKDIDNEEEINNFENVKFIEFFLNNFNC